MKATKTSSAKITRPALSEPVQRERLFTLLDAMAGKPVTWVSAPGGSGKSTLVASYLDARGLACIWYQCDEGDADLATFFYYMGLAAKKAAPRYKNPLPLLTPEYLAGIPTFTRRYFEILYSRCKTIVIDNYQDLPADSPFHDMIATGFDVIPEGVHVVVISRSEPPPALARLQANGNITVLPYSDIRFTYEESLELVHRRMPNPDNKFIQALHEKTEGWAAGIILMLERGVFDGTENESVADFSCEKVFDYIAEEIFGRAEKEIQDFLLKTAFLPILSVPLAGKLTGSDSAGRTLSTLNRQHFFTERLAGSGQSYQYHPLFRAFLLNRAKSMFAPEIVAGIQREGAWLLEQSGQIEDAAKLYGGAGDRDALVRIVTHHARELLRQGRNKTVLEWLAYIPGEFADDNPWILYWTGMCFFLLDMPRARNYFEKSFASFKETRDASGIYLSWAGIVDTHIFGSGWKELDDCITVFDDLTRTCPSFPAREIELIASSRMFSSLTLRKTDQPQLVQLWLQRVSALLQENPSFEIYMDTMFSMSMYHLWKGEYDKSVVLLERAEAEMCHRTPSPFTAIRMKLMKGFLYWLIARYDCAVNALTEGLDISAQSGVLVLDSILWSYRVAVELASGNVELAEKLLKNQLASLHQMPKPVDVFFYHVNCAWYEILNGKPSRAAEHLETVSVTVESMGMPYYRALWNIGMAQIAFLQGRTKDAKACVQTAHRISLTMKSQVMEWYALLTDAWMLLQEGDETAGLLSLHRGLTLGRKHSYIHLSFYQPEVMRFLSVKALEEGIEPEYVKWLIRKLSITPPQPLEEWPYPIKIFTLGRFEILRDDQPMHFPGKEQKKPLELLKALIAFGGRDVSMERLTDALWPDADGDQANRSFETTLSRLRKLLDGEDVLVYRARQLTLNPLTCWVDSLALEYVLDTSEASAKAPLSLREKAVSIYKGPFLSADRDLSYAVLRREKLKSRLLGVIGIIGRHHEKAEDWEIAADYYTKGIEIDGMAEELYRRLMICYRNLGNNASAAKAYNRCRSLLQTEFGIEPSPETTAVYSAITKKTVT